jgi:hypothetical protein
MKKVAKKSREEETAVCIVEWTRDGGDGHKEVLMMKRPEKGESLSTSPEPHADSFECQVS